jgi:hypothetical protein
MAELHDEALARHLKARDRQYELDTITLEYAIAWDEGQAPRVADYAARYPAFAREIAAFALYYATIGHARASDAPEAEPKPALAPAAERALGRIAASITPVGAAPETPVGQLDGLMRQGARVGYPAPKLAKRVGLSPDVLAKLEAHRIEAATVPEALVRRLATTLQVSPAAVSAFLTGPHARRGAASPRASVPRQPQPEPFLEAVRTSALSSRQKDEWAQIAAGEASTAP